MPQPVRGEGLGHRMHDDGCDDKDDKDDHDGGGVVFVSIEACIAIDINIDGD